MIRIACESSVINSGTECQDCRHWFTNLNSLLIVEARIQCQTTVDATRYGGAAVETIATLEHANAQALQGKPFNFDENQRNIVPDCATMMLRLSAQHSAEPLHVAVILPDNGRGVFPKHTAGQ